MRVKENREKNRGQNEKYYFTSKRDTTYDAIWHIICEKPAFLHDLFFLAFHLPELFIGLYYIDLYRILFFFRHSSTSFSPFSKCTVRGSKKRSFFENLKLPINPSIFA